MKRLPQERQDHQRREEGPPCPPQGKRPRPAFVARLPRSGERPEAQDDGDCAHTIPTQLYQMRKPDSREAKIEKASSKRDSPQ